MDTIDFVSADCLEIGDIIEYEDEIFEIVQLEDGLTVINLLCYSLDSGDPDVEISVQPNTVLPLKGYYYDEAQ